MALNILRPMYVWYGLTWIALLHSGLRAQPPNMPSFVFLSALTHPQPTNIEDLSV